MHLVRKLLSAATFGIWATILIPALSVWAEEPKALPPSENPSPATLAQISSLENSHYGTIQGKLSDAHTGEALIGATVRLEGTALGSATDLDGTFQIREVPEGKYALTASYMGYSKSTLDNLKVSSGQVTNTSLSLKQEAIAMDEVVVETKALRDTQGALLKIRKEASSIRDAISSEEMSKSGSGDAAQALSQVTGASVQEGKYVLIRGLGERYVTTQLNGSALPSADPDKKSVQMDLFPAKLLDNVTAIKTFTPDKPGDFTGGIINMETKSLPEKFSANFSSSRGYNSNSTSSPYFLTYAGGDRDWMGMDDGTRQLPGELGDPDVDIPTASQAYRNADRAHELDRLSKSFNTVMSPSTKTAPANSSYSLSVGTRSEVLGKPLGILGSFSYNRSFTSHNDGISARYTLTGNVSQTNELNNEMLLNDIRSTDEVVWGGLVNLAYNLSPGHELGVNYLYNRSGTSTARYLYGALPANLSAEDTYETRVLQYTERELGSLQFRGKHKLSGLLGMDLDWSTSFVSSRQDEPDVRYFTSHYTVLQADTFYSMANYIYPNPSRSFRYLDENSRDFNLALSIPFKQWSGKPSKFKTGWLYQTKDRDFNQRSFSYGGGATTYNGNPDDYFSQVGIVDSTNGRYTFGTYIEESTRPSDSYDGSQDISAVYLMLEVPILTRLNFVGGIRNESTKMRVSSHDSTLADGVLDDNDNLPSVNLTYNLGREVYIRGAYGRTLARPNLREMAPFASYEFVRDYIVNGNPDLNRTLIDNYDLRWEWYERPGELLAVSGFYKNFDNPIERVILAQGASGQIVYQNVESAKVWGMEFEVRKRLDQLFSKMRNFHLGGNLTLAHSQVDIPKSELVKLLAVDPRASQTRPLQGQSDYVLNLNVGFESFKSGTTLGIYYNIFGRRLAEVSTGGTPNIFEKPRDVVDLAFSQRLMLGFGMKFGVKNLLDVDRTKAQTYKGIDYITSQYGTGRTFSLGINYEI